MIPATLLACLIPSFICMHRNEIEREDMHIKEELYT
jgi:hypothetical protein